MLFSSIILLAPKSPQEDLTTILGFGDQIMASASMSYPGILERLFASRSKTAEERLSLDLQTLLLSSGILKQGMRFELTKRTRGKL
jgi:hypothetical protein